MIPGNTQQVLPFVGGEEDFRHPSQLVQDLILGGGAQEDVYHQLQCTEAAREKADTPNTRRPLPPIFPSKPGPLRMGTCSWGQDEGSDTSGKLQ